MIISTKNESLGYRVVVPMDKMERKSRKNK
jgi:hypothetical protein